MEHNTPFLKLAALLAVPVALNVAGCGAGPEIKRD